MAKYTELFESEIIYPANILPLNMQHLLLDSKRF